MKHALYFALGGAMLGTALTAWLAPGLIAWYFNPPVEMGGFSCTPPIAWALKRLQQAQLWGVVGEASSGWWCMVSSIGDASGRWNNTVRSLRVGAISHGRGARLERESPRTDATWPSLLGDVT
jgi:hypothetical protein